MSAFLLFPQDFADKVFAVAIKEPVGRRAAQQRLDPLEYLPLLAPVCCPHNLHRPALRKRFERVDTWSSLAMVDNLPVGQEDTCVLADA